MVHNAYLALMEDGYVKQGKQSKFGWLRDDLEDPDNQTMLHAEDDDEGPSLTCE